MNDQQKELARKALAERGGVAVESSVEQIEPTEVQVKQWVRTIGAVDSPEAEAEVTVSAAIAELRADGWELVHVESLGLQSAGVVMYYMFERYS